MATLPHGWAADYDGARWFYVYGATGQSQFQFPQPGDEFPDFGGAGATLLPAVELMPEEKLESERQVRRLLNASELGQGGHVPAADDTEESVGGEESLRGHVGTEHAGDGGGHGALCVESFAAAGPRGRQAVGGKHERRDIVDQGGHSVDDGFPVSTLTGTTDAAQQSNGELVSVPLLIAREHARTKSPPDVEASLNATTLTIMGEPVLTAVETTAAAPSVQRRGEHQPAAVARSPLAELPALDRRAIDFIQIPLGASPGGDVPELYSDSTALCEDEINPPPVELPGSEGGWIAHVMDPNLGVQTLFELPACEGSRSSPETANSTAGLRANPYPHMTMVEYHTATADVGLGGTLGVRSRGHDRADLPSQASRISPPLDEALLRDIVTSGPGQKASAKDADNPAYVSRTVQRDLSHFPSILRPGPRHPGRPVKPDTVSNTAYAVPVRLHKPPEHQGKRQNEADAPYQGISVGMPPMPPVLHPSEPPNNAITPSPGTPGGHDIGATRHTRLPSSVNFVIPISHIAAPAAPAAAAAVTRSGLPGLHHDDAWAQWPDDETASWNSDPSPESAPPLGVTRHT